jgi:plastocyanin
MLLRPDNRRGLSSSLSAVILVVILALAGAAAYLSFAQGTNSTSTSSTASAITTYPPTGTPNSSSSSLSSSLPTSSTSSPTTSITSHTTTSSTNKSQVIVVIPPGIEDLANKVSFEPINVTLVIGVNNTLVFQNHDDLEHIIESTSWPSNGQPFQFYSLPGSSVSVTLTTPGKYTYFCEWHPIWMDGSIVVLA